MCDERKSIMVPSNCIGKIIGKGGQNIRSLESDTRTKIQITKDKTGSDTEVILIGTTDQISDVEDRIKRLTLSGRSSRSFTNTAWTRPPNPKEEVVQAQSNEQPEQDYMWDDDETPQQNYTEPQQQQNYSSQQQQQNYSSQQQNYSSQQQNYAQPQQNHYQQNNYSGRSSYNNDRSNQEYSRNNDRSQRGRQSYNNRGDFNNGRQQRGFSHNNDRSYGRKSNEWTNQENGRQQSGFSHNNDQSNEWTNQDVSSKSNTQSEFSTDNRADMKFDMKALNEEYEQAQTKYWATFPAVKKVFYVELPEVANMTPEEVSAYRKSLNDLVVDRPLDDGTNKPIPNPVSSFAQAFHNYPEILEEIKKVGFVKPSPIQCQAWPVIMGGDDMIGIAQTGTGKTLAFLLPALIHIDNQELKPEFKGKPSALVLAPTRELALQIHKEVNKYNYKNIKSLCIYGGADRRAQIAELSQGADIIIATPGRLDDLVLAGHIDPEVITYVVLDEADRMLDMGFEPQIRKTLYKVRPDRQTVMTSATWPNGVRRLAISYMKNPAQIFVGSLDLTAVHSVEQVVIVMEEDDKYDYFLDFIKTIDDSQKIVVFTGKKAKASFLSSELACSGIYCSSMHGDLEQCDREQAIEDMMNGTERILVATDIISRGIDIEDITHVVNYDFPRNIEDYVHRVGRTGRAGRTGVSITYFTWSDARHAEELIRILQEADQTVPPELESMNLRYKKRAASTRGSYRRY